MSITIEELRTKHITCITGLPGGATYVVDGQHRCLRPLTKDKSEYCTHAAGWSTEHPGTGRCKYHLGHNSWKNRKPARDRGLSGNPRNVYMRKLMQNRRDKQQLKSYSDFVRQEYHTNLHNLDSLRAYLDHLLEVMTEDVSKDELNEKIYEVLAVIDKAVKTSTNARKLEQNEVLTMFELKAIISIAMSTIQKFLPAEEVPKFIAAWHKDVEGLLGIRRREDFMITDGEARVIN